ncbi:riboflavin synthase alpha chain [Aneurinibacillus soli]|uniref:Riboflavin synthase n=1 Tax=Aneurinibacillus soli TaxID=1500254 RepID=A0A0U5BLK8_9BACL|nr:riboflavin synthase [Aneurinibacillus soli]PYE62872.1 riboflavin synthase alpha chain [Aneurinibacillus soli]BAU29070.1 Riboflavin synthase [Aneurinibacillus soli]
MFTGLIEEVGALASIRRAPEAAVLAIRAQTVLKGVKIGDSIAVNGVCLTVTSYTRETFTADVMPETLARTGLGQLSPGDPVNLERALAAGERFGGHFVSGHVDGTGMIASRKPYGNAVLFEIQAPDAALRYIIPKGSVAIDGISLTVVAVTDDTFTVSVIPHTLAQTVLMHKQAGSAVNLECDMIGKYIERFLTFREEKQKSSTLTESFLSEHGFL